MDDRYQLHPSPGWSYELTKCRIQTTLQGFKCATLEDLPAQGRSWNSPLGQVSVLHVDQTHGWSPHPKSMTPVRLSGWTLSAQISFNTQALSNSNSILYLIYLPHLGGFNHPHATLNLPMISSWMAKACKSVYFITIPSNSITIPSSQFVIALTAQAFTSIPSFCKSLMVAWRGANTEPPSATPSSTPSSRPSAPHRPSSLGCRSSRPCHGGQQLPLSSTNGHDALESNECPKNVCNFRIVLVRMLI